MKRKEEFQLAALLLVEAAVLNCNKFVELNAYIERKGYKNINLKGEKNERNLLWFLVNEVVNKLFIMYSLYRF
jgi:hypothetical protein